MNNSIIKYAWVFVGAISILAFTQSENSREITKKPNFVVIMADDMGYSDLGCFGSEIQTPNLDQMANDGLKMTRFYNASRCCPTRASLQTGVYPHQAGVGSMDQPLGSSAYQGYLNKNTITIAEGLKTQGYFTAMSGKWHVGNQEDQWPTARGYDRYFGLTGGTSNYFYPHPYKLRETTRFVLNGRELPNYTTEEKPEGYYLTDEFTDYALQFLDEASRQKNPFYLLVTYNAPHFPLQALPGDIAKYRGSYKKGWDVIRSERYRKLVDMGIINKNWALSPRDSLIPAWEQMRETEKDAWDLKMAVYAAMIDRLDQNVGRILDKLKESGVDKNTLVIFLSDNGASHEYAFPLFDPSKETTVALEDLPADNPHSFVSYEYNWANVSNTPFRMFKHWEGEGGISTPFIARFPGIIQPGRINHQAAHLIDIQATLFDLAGVKYPEKYKGNRIIAAEGISFRPVLEGQSWQGHDAIYWEHQGNKAVTQGNWKIVSSFPENQWQLFDIAHDRTELHDLSQQHPEVLHDLISRYETWAKKVGVKDWSLISESQKNQ